MEVVRLIDRVQAEPWLKYVDQVKLDPKENGQRVDVTLRLKTLFLPGRAPSKAILGPSDTEVVAAAAIPERYAALIEANPFALHAHCRIISGEPAIVTGSIGPVLAATLTAVADGEDGLPADELFAHETQSLRAHNRRLMQLTLLADRRRRFTRCLDSLLEMMRLTWWYARQRGATDLLICTAADDAGIFGTLFGFAEVSEVLAGGECFIDAAFVGDFFFGELDDGAGFDIAPGADVV